jgi:hypothetical protein
VEHYIRLRVERAGFEDVYRDIVRVPELYRKDSKGNTIPEGNICKISAKNGSIFAIVRGKGDAGQESIWLDERERNVLGLAVGEEAEFKLKSVGFIGQICWGWRASDVAYRIVTRLAVASVILGIVSFLLGILSLLLVLC